MPAAEPPEKDLAGKAPPERDPSEKDLVTRASSGDLEAFERLVAKYERAVFNIALYKSKNYFDAEDLTQDIFLAAFKSLSTLKAPESFAGWLFGIAYNRCHKWFRRERNKILKIQEVRRRAAEEERRRHPPSRAEPPDGYCYPSSAPSESEHVSELFARLPPEIRETLTLKYLEGLSYQEIEQKLGINANRIDYLIRKGKQLIRDRVEARGHETPGS